MFEKATLHLENGNTFTVQAKQLSEKNKYIQSVTLNGKDYLHSYIQHQAIIQGGNLVFEMTDQPSDWGSQDAFIPETKIKDHLIVPAPYIAKGKTAFQESTAVSFVFCRQKSSHLFFFGR